MVVKSEKRTQNADSLKVRNGYAKQHVSDSIYLGKMLMVAMEYANTHKYQDSFTLNTQKLFRDSSRLSMDYGHLFDKHHKHLIIRIPGKDIEDTGNNFWDEAIVIAVYLLKDNQFILLHSDTTNYSSFSSDTIMDVNGDGYKDFVTEEYSSNGCCPRDDQYAYLYKPIEGTLTVGEELFNPTYLPKQKLTYIMSYGWPGFVSIYKCKWNGYKLDTIQEIKADTAHKNTYIVDDYITGRNFTIKGLPEEYKHLQSTDYFTSAWDK